MRQLQAGQSPRGGSLHWALCLRWEPCSPHGPSQGPTVPAPAGPPRGQAWLGNLAHGRLLGHPAKWTRRARLGIIFTEKRLVRLRALSKGVQQPGCGWNPGSQPWHCAHPPWLMPSSCSSPPSSRGSPAAATTQEGKTSSLFRLPSVLPGLAPQSPIGLPCEEWASHTALGWSLHPEICLGSRTPCQERAKPSSENQTKRVVLGTRKSCLPCLDSELYKGFLWAPPHIRVCGEEKGSRVGAARGLEVDSQERSDCCEPGSPFLHLKWGNRCSTSPCLGQANCGALYPAQSFPRGRWR